jgi:hypothetical protein
MKRGSPDFRVELTYLRDNLVGGISAQETGFVKDALEMYEQIISVFFEKLRQYGSPYDKAQTMQEIGSFEEGWSEIEGIKNDLREIIDTAFNGGNIHILRDVLHFRCN